VGVHPVGNQRIPTLAIQNALKRQQPGWLEMMQTEMFDLKKKDSKGKRIIIFKYLKACHLEIRLHSFWLFRVMANSRGKDF